MMSLFGLRIGRFWCFVIGKRIMSCIKLAMFIQYCTLGWLFGIISSRLLSFIMLVYKNMIKYLPI